LDAAYQQNPEFKTLYLWIVSKVWETVQSNRTQVNMFILPQNAKEHVEKFVARYPPVSSSVQVNFQNKSDHGIVVSKQTYERCNIVLREAFAKSKLTIQMKWKMYKVKVPYGNQQVELEMDVHSYVQVVWKLHPEELST